MSLATATPSSRVRAWLAAVAALVVRLRTARRVSAPLLLVLCAVVTLGPARAARAADGVERYVVDVRVIDGSREGDGRIDPRLGALARDLKDLPFKTFVVKDSHSARVAQGERVSLEIPHAALATKAGKKPAPRFLVVSAHGRQQGGKLRFSLGIEALKFETLVAVPEGGTIIVGGPRGENGHAVLFAVTARTQK
jgi:hypothetical protein